MLKPISTLADLTPDKRNARKHNPRNIGQIEQSLRLIGAARSGVIDEDGVILAGNGTAEALAAAGIERVRVVETDGKEWVVVRRTGLTDEQKRILSISDNRTAELATWDAPTLEASGIDLQPWFSEEELKAAWEPGKKIGNNTDPANSVDEEYQGMPDFHQANMAPFRSILIHFLSAADVEAFAAIIRQRITERTRYLYFPPLKIEPQTPYKIVGEP